MLSRTNPTGCTEYKIQLRPLINVRPALAILFRRFFPFIATISGEFICDTAIKDAAIVWQATRLSRQILLISRFFPPEERA